MAAGGGDCKGKRLRCGMGVRMFVQVGEVELSPLS